MRSFPRYVVWVLGIITLLSLVQACNYGPKKKANAPPSGQITMEAADGAAITTIEDSDITKNLPCVFEEPITELHPVGELKQKLLREIHHHGLTEERAVKLSLVNNPDLFAFYENLEIGYAGLLEAGLRQNPVVSASTRFPDQRGNINRQFDTAINFLDYFLIPLREKAAEAEIRVIESEIRQKVLDLVMEVQINWLEITILELVFNQESRRGELKQLAAQLALLQRKAGNISALSARNREIESERSQEKLQGLLANLATAKEKLNRSLGLFGNETCFAITGEVDWKDDKTLPELSVMESAAIENRPDIETIQREIDAIAEQAHLKQWWTYSHLKVGTSSERDTDGVIVSGPFIELELPIFNFGQGERKKYHALLEQAQKKLLAKAVEACSEVREFVKTANIYRSQLEDLERRILPNLARQITEGLAHYNVMTLGIYELFDLKEAEIEATIEQLQALRHYETAQIALLHAMGGSFTSLGRTE